MYSRQLNLGYFCHFCHFSKMLKHGHCWLPWQPENMSNKKNHNGIYYIKDVLLSSQEYISLYYREIYPVRVCK